MKNENLIQASWGIEMHSEFNIERLGVVVKGVWACDVTRVARRWLFVSTSGISRSHFRHYFLSTNQRLKLQDFGASSFSCVTFLFFSSLER